MLYRKIAGVIENHLKSNTNKILLVDGARQVGKTFIIRYVGQKLFKNFIEVNMVEDSLGEKLFENIKTVDDFYLQLSMIAGNKMGSIHKIRMFPLDFEEFLYANGFNGFV